MNFLVLSLLGVFINTSWTANINTNQDLQRDILQNNDELWKNPRERTSKQVDQRIADIIAENVLHFGHNLGLELSALDPHAMRSEIFSPISLMAALSMLTLGAKGRSYHELKQILGLDSDSEIIYNPNKYHEEFGLMLQDLQHSNVNSGGVNKRPNANWRYTQIKSPSIRISGRNKTPSDHIIKIANGLFVQNGYTLNADYSQVLQSVYQTELTELDFQNRNRESRDYINAWVNKATFGKIPQIIKDDIDKSTNIILASALYFKAFWETSFFFESTAEGNFYPDGEHNPPITVQMMPNGGIFPFYDAKEYDCRIIGLPYKGNETTMYIIQPNNSSRLKLRQLQHVLDAHKINGMIENMERKTAVMVFPKMHFTRSFNMKEILQTMSVRDIFVNGYSDLSLIAQGPRKPYTADFATMPQRQSVAQNLPFAEFAAEKVSTERVPVSFESIDRKKPVYQNPQFTDRYNEPALIFSSRFGEIDNLNNNTKSFMSNDTTNPTDISTTPAKLLTTNATQSSNKREKRQVSRHSLDPTLMALKNLESNRQKADSYRADLYVDDILHSIDFSVDEQGTEAAAATFTSLHRSGTDVIFRGDTPFLIVIRHDPTKLPLFYGIINKPEL